MSVPKPRITLSSNDTSTEGSFRSSLEDVITVVDGLKSFCTTPDELAGLCRLALENDAQLRILLATLTDPVKK